MAACLALPRYDVMVWRAASRLVGLGSVLILVTFLSITSLLLLGTAHYTSLRFRKYLYLAKHVTVCYYIICKESYLKCMIGSRAAYLLQTAQTNLPSLFKVFLRFF